MRINPIDLILNENFKIDKYFYLISGNEITLINKVREIIISGSSEFSIEKIKNISNVENTTNLFSEKNIYIVDDPVGLDNKKLEELSLGKDRFVLLCENAPKIKTLKNLFMKSSKLALVDCYELSKEDKSKIVRKFLQDLSINLDQGLFWALMDKFDNKYGFLEKEMHKIREVGKSKINLDFINSMISENHLGGESVFFQILKSNNEIINIYNKKIVSGAEVNALYLTLKQFSLLIINSNSEADFVNNIPRYLFREKFFLLDLFKKYNSYKKKSLVDLLFKAEKSLRKESGLSVSVGLRILLGFKKITIS